MKKLKNSLSIPGMLQNTYENWKTKSKLKECSSKIYAYNNKTELLVWAAFRIELSRNKDEAGRKSYVIDSDVPSLLSYETEMHFNIIKIVNQIDSKLWSTSFKNYLME